MKKAVRKLLNRMSVPKTAIEQRCLALAPVISQMECIAHGQGLLQSTKAMLPINSLGQPLPWFTFPAIEYLNQLDLATSSIFEYGCGNGSLYWAERAELVWSTESDADWMKKITAVAPSNLNIIFAEDRTTYANSIRLAGKKFDIIVVDGDFRLSCAQEAVSYLNPGGMIILDNADWFPETASFLRASDLIQVDMFGLGPGLWYSWATSFFLRRDFSLKPITARSPSTPIGGILQTKNED